MEQPTTAIVVKKPASSSSKLGLLLASISLVGLVLVILAGICFWAYFQQALTEQNRLQTTVSQQQAELTAAEQQLQTANATLQQLAQQQQRHTQDWSLAEAEYLVHLANLNLIYSNNVKAAIALVQAADQAIAKFNDPALVPARQALAHDLASLRAVPNVDLIGLLAKLNALSQQVANLPLAAKTMPKSETDQGPVTSVASTESVWQKALNNVSHAFRQMVVVHHADQTAMPLISPEQQVFLIENIQLKLAQAEWAAIQGEADIYQASIKQAAAWIQQYFAGNSATQGALKTLDELAQINVKPSLPTLDNSLQVIQSILQKNNKANATAVKQESA